MRDHSQRMRLSQRLWLEHLERRDVPALILDLDLVRESPANFRADSLLVKLMTWETPNYNLGAYAPGLQLVQNYQLVPNLYEAKIVGQSLVTTLENLQPNTKVELVQPNARFSVENVPNDPSFSRLYAMNNSGQTGGTFDADIDAAEAWNSTTGTGQTVVAVIDTGVDYNHPDLAANIWTNPGEIAGNGVDDDGNGYVDDIHGYDFVNNDANPMDDNGHGTHVSGTIGAVGNNGIGVAGVNWHTKIMALKFLDASGSGYLSDAIRALDYAVANGARISNNSWGGGGYEATLGQAIARAGAIGHIFVAAAGNSANNNDVKSSYPANYAYDNVVAVAATDQNDNLASFSNYGPTTVDIAAPGVSIYSTLPGNSYASYSGTSMATPHVTGALSLYLDANPTATYKQAINALYQSADSLPSLQNRVAGARRLNVGKMLQGTSTAPPPADTKGAKVDRGQFNLSNGQVISATLNFSEAVDPINFSPSDVILRGPSGFLSVSNVVAVAGTGNTQFTVTFNPFSQSGVYSLQVGPAVLDAAGNPLDQNGNGVNGETTDVFTLSWTQQSQLVFTNPTDVAIRDLRTVSSSITVSSDLLIGDLNVRINLNHSYVSDLVITLQSPSGVQYTLFNRRGGSGDNLRDTLFDDQATRSIITGVAPFTGAFAPENALTSLNGRNAKGTWVLYISDRQSLDTGKLLDWSLEFTQQSQTATVAGKKIPIGLFQSMATISQVNLQVGQMWSGGALLTTDQAITPVQAARIVTGTTNTQPSAASTGIKPALMNNAMQAILDRAIWSRSLEEMSPSKNRIRLFGGF